MSNKKQNQQMNFDTRHKQFLDAGKKLVKGDDVSKVTAAAVARACGCTAPLVFAHFKDRDVLRDAVRQYAKTGKVTGLNHKATAKPKIAVVKAIKVAAAKKAAPKAVKKAKSGINKTVPKPAAKKTTAKKPVVKVAAKKASTKKPAIKVAASPKFATPAAPTVAVVG